MIAILIAIILAAGAGTFLLMWAEGGYSALRTAAGLLGLLLAFAAGISSIAYAFTGWSWFAADYRADIINREYGTNYTQAEVFWAANVIDTIRQLERKRIEVNGDIMRDEPDTRAED